MANKPLTAAPFPTPIEAAGSAKNPQGTPPFFVVPLPVFGNGGSGPGNETPDKFFPSLRDLVSSGLNPTLLDTPVQAVVAGAWTPPSKGPKQVQRVVNFNYHFPDITWLVPRGLPKAEVFRARILVVAAPSYGPSNPPDSVVSNNVFNFHGESHAAHQIGSVVQRAVSTRAGQRFENNWSVFVLIDGVITTAAGVRQQVTYATLVALPVVVGTAP
jgi:hypothetical protein